jgi:multidrug resistance efflux pump
MRGLQTPDVFIDSLQKLQALRNFAGEPLQFWETYLTTLLELTGAKAGVLCLRDSGKEWRTLAFAPKSQGHEQYLRIFLTAIETCHKMCLEKGAALIPTKDYTIIGCPIVLDAQQGSALFLGYLPHSVDKNPTFALNAAKSIADLYAQYRIRQSVNDSVTMKANLTSIFEITHLVNIPKRFLEAAMTLVNELANRNQCDRVSLGWVKKGYVRVLALSHTDTFEKKMEIVRNLENAMEEAFEQDADIVFPLPENSRLVARAHEFYHKTHDTGYLLSVPVRREADIIGILTFERVQAPFTESEATRLQLTAGQVSTHLGELYCKDRWFGARLASTLRNGLAKGLGYEHTWLKLLLIFLSAFLGFAFFVPIPYRVDSPTILLTDKIVFVTAPFDGYIDSVFVKPGDPIQKGQKILRLDQKQFLLEEADYMAEEQNYHREIQKAQAAAQLAEMRVFQAKLAQTQAKLKTTRFKLEQAIIRSPVDNAVVVEGDLEKRLGAPVSLGAELFQIALIENIYAEIDVDEMEIKNVKPGAEGVVAIKSRPDYVYRFRVARIHPAATIKDQENTFQVRGEFIRNVPEWFRPGMTGVAKIESGKHTLWWILSHRAIDILRLKLWW